MSIKVENLYEHADGGFYCILSDAAPYKDRTTGDWLDGVIYMGTDGVMRSTTRERWDERFSPVADYTGDDEQVLMMVRRANPGNVDFDFLRVFESWHESEMGITGHMLELAVGAAIESFVWGGAERSHVDFPDSRKIKEYTLTIKTEDLQRVVQNYEIERVPIPHGFTFVMRK
jgi:hypothetical protein